MKIQEATQVDIKDIQTIEKEYYEGFSCPKDILGRWIKTKNFLLAKNKKDNSVAFLFFEEIKTIKALPFIHKLCDEPGSYLYISEVGILNKYIDTNILELLFKELLKRNKRKKGVVWVTGSKSKHDKVELGFKKLDFKKIKKVEKWEAYPNHFVKDHWIWFKKIN